MSTVFLLRDAGEDGNGCPTYPNHAEQIPSYHEEIGSGENYYRELFHYRSRNKYLIPEPAQLDRCCSEKNYAANCVEGEFKRGFEIQGLHRSSSTGLNRAPVALTRRW